MLVLSRKVGQELVIGDNIRITVNRVGGSRVTLGISAPQDVRIVRGELEPIVTSFEVDVPLDASASDAGTTGHQVDGHEFESSSASGEKAKDHPGGRSTIGGKSAASKNSIEARLAERKARPARPPKSLTAPSGSTPANGTPTTSEAGPVNRVASIAVKSAGASRTTGFSSESASGGAPENDGIKRRIH